MKTVQQQNTGKEMKISCLENIIQESTQFLHTLMQETTSRTTVGVSIRAVTTSGFDKYAVLYKRKDFILVIPEGKKQDALLYGSWEEALHASKRIVTDGIRDEKPTVSIYQYHL